MKTTRFDAQREEGESGKCAAPENLAIPPAPSIFRPRPTGLSPHNRGPAPTNRSQDRWSQSLIIRVLRMQGVPLPSQLLVRSLPVMWPRAHAIC